MKTLLTIFVLFSSSSVLAQNNLYALDGKSIICKSIDEPVYPTIGIYGFRFIGNKVTGDYFVVGNDEVKIVNFNTNFVTSITIGFVTWWGGEYGTGWKLNRETLFLVYNDDITPHQCKVTSNIEAYNKEMEWYKFEQLQILKHKLKKNKI